ncbi:hypothetical protein B566_EDAN001672 [Ephemera danica]|nr:hypothetical protein B566_EDAN001672 [Ephemera danica]
MMVIMIKRKQNQEKVPEEKDDESIIIASTPLNRNLRNVRAQQVVPIQLSPVLDSRALSKNRLKSKNKEEIESKVEVATKTDAATAAKIAEKPASQSLKNPIVNTNRPVELVIDDSDDDVTVVTPKRNVKVAKTKTAPAKSVSKKPVQKNNVVSPPTNPMPAPSKPVPEKLPQTSPLKRPMPRLNFETTPEQELSQVIAQPGQSTQNFYPKVNDFLVIDDENLHAPIQTGKKEKPTKTSNRSASPKNLKKGITAKQPSAKKTKTKKSDELNAAPESENDGSCDSEALHEEENVPVLAEPMAAQTKEVKNTFQSDSSEESDQSQTTVEQVVTSKKRAVDVMDSETEDQAETPLPKTKNKVLRQSNTASQKKTVKNEKISTTPVEDTRTKSRGRRAAQPVSNQQSPKETMEELGGRRSQRSRVKPVKYWAGEHMLYKEDSKGELEVLQVKLGTDESDKPDTKGRPRKDLYTVGSLLRKLASPADQMEENEDLPPDVDLPTLIHMKLPFNAAQPKKLTEIEVASEVRNLEAISKMEGTSKEDSNIRYSTTLDSSFVSCGYIRINAGSSKGLQISQNMTVFSLLTSSKLVVTINGEKINIGFGQHFWVPPGIAYDIKNLSSLPSLLQFSTVDIREAHNVLGHKK